MKCPIGGRTKRCFENGEADILLEIMKHRHLFPVRKKEKERKKEKKEREEREKDRKGGRERRKEEGKKGGKYKKKSSSRSAELMNA